MNGSIDWHQVHSEFAHLAQAQGFSAQPMLSDPMLQTTAWIRRADGPRIYLSSGIHGDEPAGPLALLELMRNGFFQTNIDWRICPLLNPSGLASNTRENADGMDLNRDYLIHRSKETQAHVAWLAQQPVPDLFISLHEDWEGHGFYFYEINQGEDRPQLAHTLLAAVAPWFEPEPGPEIDGHNVREPGWIYHPAEPDVPEGWPEAIYLAKMGCPRSFTLESPSRGLLDDRSAALQAAVRCIIAGI
ncbi:MAG: DUF2817 domain-containing protein [Verrucomicrobia bacterium]|nr:MAG: DUF2817 domain-containing protein [Verrucomicrobiota bacterium]